LLLFVDWVGFVMCSHGGCPFPLACFCRKLASTKATDSNGLKCAIDHILEAQQKGEINEDNVLFIVENINVAGKLYFRLS
jgi:hypothetical protein